MPSILETHFSTPNVLHVYRTFCSRVMRFQIQILVVACSEKQCAEIFDFENYLKMHQTNISHKFSHSENVEKKLGTVNLTSVLHQLQSAKHDSGTESRLNVCSRRFRSSVWWAGLVQIWNSSIFRILFYRIQNVLHTYRLIWSLSECFLKS